MVERYFAESEADAFVRKTFFPDWSYKGTMVEVGAATPEFLSVSEHCNGYNYLFAPAGTLATAAVVSMKNDKDAR